MTLKTEPNFVSAQEAEVFDVFLCHNSEDKAAIREIARKLVEKGIKSWLDEEQIRPGTSWQTALGQQIESIKSAAVFVGESGIGPWQNEEIQAFLSEFMRRGCPVIPVILASAKTTPEFPWTLKNRHRVDFRVSDPDPLQQLIWGITGEKPAKASLLPSDAPKISKDRLYPPLAEPPDREQATQLEILRRRVMEYWAEGVLKHSLHNEVLISLGKRPIDKAVNAPWKYTVEVAGAANSAPLDDRDVSAIYDATGLLLILGEPGSGKTTTLLDLARTLLERAGKDLKERVPVVLNLSSWREKKPSTLVERISGELLQNYRILRKITRAWQRRREKKPLALAEWIAGELSDKYRVPRKIARFWLEHGYLLPLLDGLDEVETRMRPDCVAAINAFIEESNPSGLVVCCRLLEYQWLPKRLKLNGAICLEPLSPDEVSKYLDRGGHKLAMLREAVNTDPVLQELAQTPLMLSIMSLAYLEASGDELASQKEASPEERRKQVFDFYLEQMFRRRETSHHAFPKEKTIGCLSRLARKMREHSESVFLVEGLQPSWLSTRAQKVVYGTVVVWSLGLVFGLVGGVIGGLRFGLTGGLTSALAILVGVGLVS